MVSKFFRKQIAVLLLLFFCVGSFGVATTSAKEISHVQGVQNGHVVSADLLAAIDAFDTKCPPGKTFDPNNPSECVGIRSDSINPCALGLAGCDTGTNQATNIAGIKQTVIDIVNNIFFALGFIATVILVIEGILLILARGSEDRRKKVQTTIVNIFLGFALIIMSYAIVRFIVDFLSGGDAARQAVTFQQNGGGTGGGSGGGTKNGVFTVSSVNDANNLVTTSTPVSLGTKTLTYDSKKFEVAFIDGADVRKFVGTSDPITFTKSLITPLTGKIAISDLNGSRPDLNDTSQLIKVMDIKYRLYQEDTQIDEDSIKNADIYKDFDYSVNPGTSTRYRYEFILNTSGPSGDSEEVLWKKEFIIQNGVNEDAYLSAIMPSIKNESTKVDITVDKQNIVIGPLSKIATFSVADNNDLLKEIQVVASGATPATAIFKKNLPVDITFPNTGLFPVTMIYVFPDDSKFTKTISLNVRSDNTKLDITPDIGNNNTVFTLKTNPSFNDSLAGVTQKSLFLKRDVDSSYSNVPISILRSVDRKDEFSTSIATLVSTGKLNSSFDFSKNNKFNIRLVANYDNGKNSEDYKDFTMLALKPEISMVVVPENQAKPTGTFILDASATKNTYQNDVTISIAPAQGVSMQTIETNPVTVTNGANIQKDKKVQLNFSVKGTYLVTVNGKNANGELGVEKQQNISVSSVLQTGDMILPSNFIIGQEGIINMSNAKNVSKLEIIPQINGKILATITVNSDKINLPISYTFKEVSGTLGAKFTFKYYEPNSSTPTVSEDKSTSVIGNGSPTPIITVKQGTQIMAPSKQCPGTSEPAYAIFKGKNITLDASGSLAGDGVTQLVSGFSWEKDGSTNSLSSNKEYTFIPDSTQVRDTCIGYRVTITEGTNPPSSSNYLRFYLVNQLPKVDLFTSVTDPTNKETPTTVDLVTQGLVDPDTPTIKLEVEWYYTVDGTTQERAGNYPTVKTLDQFGVVVSPYGTKGEIHQYTFFARAKDTDTGEKKSFSFGPIPMKTGSATNFVPRITTPARIDPAKAIGIDYTAANKSFQFIGDTGLGSQLPDQYTLQVTPKTGTADWIKNPISGTYCRATSISPQTGSDGNVSVTNMPCGMYDIKLAVTYNGQTQIDTIIFYVYQTAEDAQKAKDVALLGQSPLRTPLALFASTTIMAPPEIPHLSPPDTALLQDSAHADSFFVNTNTLIAESSMFTRTGFGIKPLQTGTTSRGEAFGVFDSGTNPGNLDAIKRRLQARDTLFAGLSSSQTAVLERLLSQGVADRTVIDPAILKKLYGMKPGFTNLSLEELELIRRLTADGSENLRKTLTQAEQAVVTKLQKILEGTDSTPLDSNEKKIRDNLVQRFVSSTSDANLAILQKLFGNKTGLKTLTPGEIELLGRVMDNDGNLRLDGFTDEEKNVLQKLKNKLDGKDPSTLTQAEEGVKRLLMQKYGITDPQAGLVDRLQGATNGLDALRNKIEAAKLTTTTDTGGNNALSPFNDPSTKLLFGCGERVVVRFPGGQYGLACNDKKIFSDDPTEIDNYLRAQYPQEYAGLFAPLVADMAPGKDPETVRAAMDKLIATLRVMGASDSEIEKAELLLAKRYVNIDKEDANSPSALLKSGADDLSRTLASILGGEKDVSEETIDALIESLKRVGEGNFEDTLAKEKLLLGLRDVVEATSIPDSTKLAVMNSVEVERKQLITDTKGKISAMSISDKEKKLILQSLDELMNDGRGKSTDPKELLKLYQKTLSSMDTLLGATLLDDSQKADIQKVYRDHIQTVAKKESALLAEQFQQNDPTILRALQNTESILRSQSAVKRGSDSILSVWNMFSTSKDFTPADKAVVGGIMKKQIQGWVDTAKQTIEKSNSLTQEEKKSLIKKLQTISPSMPITDMLKVVADVYQTLQTKKGFLKEGDLYRSLSENFSLSMNTALNDVRDFVMKYPGDKLNVAKRTQLLKSVDYAQERLFSSLEVVDGLIGIYRALAAHDETKPDLPEIQTQFYKSFKALLLISETVVRGDIVRVLLPFYLQLEKAIGTESDDKAGVEKRLIQYKNFYRIILKQRYYYNVAKARISSLTESFVFDVRDVWEPYMKKAHLSYYDTAEEELMNKIRAMSAYSGSPESYLVKLEDIRWSILTSATLPLTVKDTMLRAFDQNGAMKSLLDANQNCPKVYVKDPVNGVRSVCTQVRAKENLPLALESEQKKTLSDDTLKAADKIKEILPATSPLQGKIVSTLQNARSSYLSAPGTYGISIASLSSLSRDSSLTQEQQNNVRAELFSVAVVRDSLLAYEREQQSNTEKVIVQRSKAEQDMLTLQAFVEKTPETERVVAREAFGNLEDALYRDPEMANRAATILSMILTPTLGKDEVTPFKQLLEKYATVGEPVTHSLMLPERSLLKLRIAMQQFVDEPSFSTMLKHQDELLDTTKKASYLEALGVLNTIEKDVTPLYAKYKGSEAQFQEVLSGLKVYYVYLDNKRSEELKAEEIKKAELGVGKDALEKPTPSNENTLQTNENTTPQASTNIFMTLLVYLGFALGGILGVVLLLGIVLFVFYMIHKRQNPDLHMDFEEYMLNAREHIFQLFGGAKDVEAKEVSTEGNDLPRMPQTELPPENEEISQEKPSTDVVEGEVVTTSDTSDETNEVNDEDEDEDEDTQSNEGDDFTEDNEDTTTTSEEDIVTPEETDMLSPMDEEIEEDTSIDQSDTDAEDELETPSWLLDDDDATEPEIKLEENLVPPVVENVEFTPPPVIAQSAVPPISIQHQPIQPHPQQTIPPVQTPSSAQQPPMRPQQQQSMPHPMQPPIRPGQPPQFPPQGQAQRPQTTPPPMPGQNKIPPQTPPGNFQQPQNPVQ